MKKTLLALVMSVIMIGLASCGGGNKHSKAYNESVKILDNITEAINQADDCDGLEAAAFGILGLLGVEGLDQMPDVEQEELTKVMEEMNTLLEKKQADFGCEEEEFLDDEMPLGEPIEEE